MNAKPILKSRTFNVNAVLVGLIGILATFGIELPTGLYEALLGAIPLANIILRLVTKQPVTLTGAAGDGVASQ
jgi:hypothetical protein